LQTVEDGDDRIMAGSLNLNQLPTR
jgi:hypothetical protein